MTDNFVEVHCWSPVSAEFMYFDTPDYKADEIFLEKRLYPRFFEEMGRDDSPYVLVRCRVKRRDKHKFIRAMDALGRKMLLTGYPDYLKDTKRIWDELLNDADENNDEGK